MRFLYARDHSCGERTSVVVLSKDIDEFIMLSIWIHHFGKRATKAHVNIHHTHITNIYTHINQTYKLNNSINK